jgi:hypothetical protein
MDNETMLALAFRQLRFHILEMEITRRVADGLWDAGHHKEALQLLVDAQSLFHGNFDSGLQLPLKW